MEETFHESDSLYYGDSNESVEDISARQIAIMKSVQLGSSRPPTSGQQSQSDNQQDITEDIPSIHNTLVSWRIILILTEHVSLFNGSLASISRLQVV